MFHSNEILNWWLPGCKKLTFKSCLDGGDLCRLPLTFAVSEQVRTGRTSVLNWFQTIALNLCDTFNFEKKRLPSMQCGYKCNVLLRISRIVITFYDLDMLNAV